MSDNEEVDIQKELTKELAIKVAEVREAFILEEMRPFYDYKDGNIEFVQKVKLQLAEIKDYQDNIKSIIDELIEYWAQQDYAIVGPMKTHYQDILQQLRYKLFGECYKR